MHKEPKNHTKKKNVIIEYELEWGPLGPIEKYCPLKSNSKVDSTFK